MVEAVEPSASAEPLLPPVAAHEIDGVKLRWKRRVLLFLLSTLALCDAVVAVSLLFLCGKSARKFSYNDLDSCPQSKVGSFVGGNTSMLQNGPTGGAVTDSTGPDGVLVGIVFLSGLRLLASLILSLCKGTVFCSCFSLAGILTSVIVAVVEAPKFFGSAHSGEPEHALLLSAIFFGVAEFAIMWQYKNADAAVAKYSKAEKESATKKDDDDDDGPALSFWQLMVVLKPYFWPKGTLDRVRALTTYLILGVSKAANIWAPLWIQSATNALINKNFTKAITGVCMYCFLILISKCLRELQSVVYLRVQQVAFIEISESTFAHMHSLSLEWHLRKKMGDVLRSLDRGVTASNSMVKYVFLYLVPTFVECGLVCGIFLLHFNEWMIATLILISLVFYSWVTIVITLWRKQFRKNQNKGDNKYHDVSTDSLVNFETVKTFTSEAYEVGRFTDAVKIFQTFSVMVQASLSVLNSVQQVILQTTMALSLVISAHSIVYCNDSSVGQFVAVQVYIMQLFTPLNFLGTIYNMVINGLVDLEKLSKILAERPDVRDIPNAKQLALPGIGSNRPLGNMADGGAGSDSAGSATLLGVSVEFRNVYFHYPSQRPSSGLQDVCWFAAPGTTTAIVGHTGSGKTTVGRLLFRFYDCLQGSVLLHGQKLSELTQQSVRKAIGIVPQDTVLFNESIRYNISYGMDMKLDTPMEKIREAAEGAKILDFIENLPDKWETQVGERGLKLSGGEKQRVAIARCLLKNPPVVLLDEATSALDTRTEHSVQEALLALGKARTTIVIAHRLSTIKHAEQIVVLEKGRVVETGTHQSLMKAAKDVSNGVDWSTRDVCDNTEGESAASGSGLPRSGVYRAMWEAQLRGLDLKSNLHETEEVKQQEDTACTDTSHGHHHHHGHSHG